jgi:hypothetical protein
MMGDEEGWIMVYGEQALRSYGDICDTILQQ